MRVNELQPQFVLVMGGAGSGKNYYIRNNPTLNNYTLIDVDEIKKTVELSLAIKQTKEELVKAFNQKLDVVHPTTGSNFKGNFNKIELAKKNGYKVVVILIDTPIEQAIKNVSTRVSKGEHNVERDAIIASNQKARANFEQLSQYADKSIVI